MSRSMKAYEDALRAHYRAQRAPVDEDARRATCVAVAAEARARSARAQRPTAAARVREHAAFVATQARFMGIRAWALQACAVALVLASAWANGAHYAAGMFACFAGVAVAVCGLPDLLASRMCGIVELERSCRYGARAVSAARMVVLACSNAVALFVATAFAADFADAASLLLCAFAPYFVTTAGCLAAARHMTGVSAFAAACGWAGSVSACAYIAAVHMPQMYAQASVWVWALACAAAFVWTAFEARSWLIAAATSEVLAFDSSYINR